MQAFIYTLSDPRTNEVRYIGKTKRSLTKRLWEHITYLENKTYKSTWIKSLKKIELKPKIKLLDIVNDSEWQFWEQYYISLFKSWEFKLTNLSNGGEDGVKVSIKSWYKNNGRKVEVYNLKGELLNTFTHLSSAEKYYQIKHPSGLDSAKGKTWRAGNYLFRYQDILDKRLIKPIVKEKDTTRKCTRVVLKNPYTIFPSITQANISLNLKLGDISRSIKDNKPINGYLSYRINKQLIHTIKINKMFTTKNVDTTESLGLGKYIGYGISELKINKFEVKVAGTGAKNILLYMETRNIDKVKYPDFEPAEGSTGGQVGKVTMYQYWLKDVENTESESHQQFMRDIGLIADKMGVREMVDNINAKNFDSYVDALNGILTNKFKWWKITAEQYHREGKSPGTRLFCGRYSKKTIGVSDVKEKLKFDKENSYDFKPMVTADVTKDDLPF